MDQIVKNEATQLQILTPGPHVFELLTPDIHLVDASWKDIRKWVARTHGAAGWQLKRRTATELERKTPGYTRRGKTYFITAVHKGVKKPKKTKTKKKTTSKKSKKAAAALTAAVILAKKTLPPSVFSEFAKEIHTLKLDVEHRLEGKESGNEESGDGSRSSGKNGESSQRRRWRRYDV